MLKFHNFYVLTFEELVRCEENKIWYQIFTNVKNRYQTLTLVTNRYQILTSVKNWYQIIIIYVNNWYPIITHIKNWYLNVTHVSDKTVKNWNRMQNAADFEGTFINVTN